MSLGGQHLVARVCLAVLVVVVISVQPTSDITTVSQLAANAPDVISASAETVDTNFMCAPCGT